MPDEKTTSGGGTQSTSGARDISSDFPHDAEPSELETNHSTLASANSVDENDDLYDEPVARETPAESNDSGASNEAEPAAEQPAEPAIDETKLREAEAAGIPGAT